MDFQFHDLGAIADQRRTAMLAEAERVRLVRTLREQPRAPLGVRRRFAAAALALGFALVRFGRRLDPLQSD